MQGDQNAGPVLIRGIITNLTKRRASYEAIFTEADKKAMERTALAAALVGLNDIALNLSSSTQFTDTVGDLVTFRINGEQVRAWIWLSVFENGDEVEVVAEKVGLGWMGYAIRRCSDGVLSVHPHCERGSWANFKFFLKWSSLFWTGCALAFSLIVFLKAWDQRDVWLSTAGYLSVDWLAVECLAIFIAYRLSRRFKRQLPMANKIFETFGWRNHASIDLTKTSKKLKRPGDGWQMGKLIFRYTE